MANLLSVVIITKNEQQYIADAVRSAAFADEVLVLDNFSEDRTREIAASMGARVLTHEWLGFGVQKNMAVNSAKNDWVFVLDADERITPDLQKEILSTLKKPAFAAYFVARRNWFFGKPIRYCGLYPDYSIRLFDRREGRFNEVAVHESVQCQGETGYLRHPMKHRAYETVDEFINKQKRYAQLSAKPKNGFKAIVSPIWVMLKIYLIRAGFLEGWRGLVIAWGYARYTFWKYSQ